MRHRVFSFTLLAFALLLSTAAAASAQSDRGTVTGRVTDPQGAVVPNAKVTATSIDTGDVREATTSDEGGYTLPELRAGLWRVSVEAAGFKTTTVDRYKVAVQVTHTLDFTLEVGAVADVVTVTGDAAAAIQADSPVRQSNVTERQIKELPLQVSSEFAGRTPLSFIFLDSNVTVGTATGGQGTNTSNFRVSGGQALGTEILIDGATTRRTQNGTFFSEVAPGPNAFQEFTISTSSYSAEFGNSSGGIVNLTQKSGTNVFHGELYDLLRNEALNANGFRSNANNLERAPDKQNDFGGNVGGPIYLPHFGEGGPVLNNFKNRAFFFFNFEGYRFKEGENVILTVPTARMRTGDFSELLTDPYIRSFRFCATCPLAWPNGVQIYDPRQPSDTRVAVPGNRLDQYLGGARIDRAGFNILQAFPLPNRTGPNGSSVFQNYSSSTTRPTNMDQWTAKLDFNLSDRQHLTTSYSTRSNDRIATSAGRFPRFPLPFIAQDVWSQEFKSYFARIQHDYTFSPNLLNHFNLGFNRFDVRNRNTSEGFNTSSLGLPANASQNIAFPRVGFPGYGDPISSNDPRAYQDIGSSFFTDHIWDNSWHISDAVTYIRGRHSLKLGAEVRPGQFNFFQRIDPGASFNFRNDQTAADRDPDGGWPIASLLTGATEFSFNSTDSVDPSFRQLTQGYFVQDDIKLTPRLTINVGARYDLPGLRTESHGAFRGFDPTKPNPEAGGRLGAIAGVIGQGGVQADRETLAKPDHSNFGPRVGFAYSLNEKTVVRGGGGLYYAPILYGFEGNNELRTGLLGYNSGSGARTPNGRNAVFFLSTYPSIPPVCPSCQFLGSDVQFFDPDFKTGRTVQWSLDLQRELPYNFVASAGYIGHKATRLRSNFGRLNALPFNALRLGFPLLIKNVNDLNTADRNYAASVGITLPSSPNAVYSGFNGSVAQALKPFPQYNRINNLLESQGTSDYNALQLKLERRFAQGIQAGASYTWSKLLTNAAEDLFGGTPNSGVLQNPFNANLRSESANNPRHVFVANFLFELPFGKGRRFLNEGGVLDRLVGGWQLSGIARYQSGVPLSLFTSDPFYTDFLQTTGYLGNLRLNPTGAAVDASRTFDAARIGLQSFNAGAFAPPPRFGSFGSATNENPSGAAIGSTNYALYYANPARFFGTTAPTLSNVRSDPFSNEDLSLLKKTRITETVSLELGAEAFNVFNRHRFFFPTTDLRDAANFGFQSVNNDRFGRTIQLRARLLF
ncbi:MAG: TonB-dependent receptor [Acidobacteria bacterium]|nr:TonB-dependent receptor [Acidobacteriota bacterium]